MTVNETPTMLADLVADTVYTIQNQGSINVNLYLNNTVPDLTDETLKYYIIFGKTETYFSLSSGENAYVWSDYGNTEVFTIEAP